MLAFASLQAAALRAVRVPNQMPTTWCLIFKSKASLTLRWKPRSEYIYKNLLRLARCRFLLRFALLALLALVSRRHEGRWPVDTTQCESYPRNGFRNKSSIESRQSHWDRNLDFIEVQIQTQYQFQDLCAPSIASQPASSDTSNSLVTCNKQAASKCLKSKLMKPAKSSWKVDLPLIQCPIHCYNPQGCRHSFCTLFFGLEWPCAAWIRQFIYPLLQDLFARAG